MTIKCYGGTFLNPDQHGMHWPVIHFMFIFTRTKDYSMAVTYNERSPCMLKTRLIDWIGFTPYRQYFSHLTTRFESRPRQTQVVQTGGGRSTDKQLLQWITPRSRVAEGVPRYKKKPSLFDVRRRRAFGLHGQWWRLIMSENFSRGTINNNKLTKKQHGNTKNKRAKAKKNLLKTVKKINSHKDSCMEATER